MYTEKSGKNTQTIFLQHWSQQNAILKHVFKDIQKMKNQKCGLRGKVFHSFLLYLFFDNNLSLIFQLPQNVILD